MTVTLALALAALGPADGTPQPLTCPKPIIDLGEVKSGPPCSHTFELKNDGPAEITIGGVTPGCGCSKVELTAKQLPPGGTAKLTVTTNTLTQPEGMVYWPVGVSYRTTVGGQSFDGRLDLKVAAKVVREVSVTPPLLAVSTTGGITQVLTVQDRRTTPLTVRKAESTTPEVTVEVRPAKSADGRREQEVIVTVGEGLKVGSHAVTVTLHTDDSTCPTLTVPVKVHKRAADGVTALPETARVRFATAQVEASALVQLRGGGKRVAIQKVECTTPGVTVKYSEDPGPVAAVRVVVNAKTAGASGTGEVTVTLSEPTATTVVIPVTWYAP